MSKNYTPLSLGQGYQIEALECTASRADALKSDVIHICGNKVLCKLDWVPGVCFGEDASTKRAGRAAENFSFISKVGLNLLNQSDESKGSKKLSIKRKKADRDKDYLLSLLAKSG